MQSPDISFRNRGVVGSVIHSLPRQGMENRRSRQFVCLQGGFPVAVGFHTHLATAPTPTPLLTSIGLEAPESGAFPTISGDLHLVHGVYSERIF